MIDIIAGRFYVGSTYLAKNQLTFYGPVDEYNLINTGYEPQNMLVDLELCLGDS